MSNSSELDRNVKNYLIDNFDFSGYDNRFDNKTTVEKIAVIEEIFISEYGFNIARFGQVQALREWLSGLPSCINIAFYNYDILNLAIKWGSIPEGYTEKQADKILENYFNLLAVKLNQLFRGYRLPKEVK